jgi:hypothetical protein
MIKIARQFNEWMFGWGSPVTMGVIRILFSGLIFINLVLILPGFRDWFTEPGFVPLLVNQGYYGDMNRINVFHNVTDANVSLAIYVGIMIASLMTCLGLFTRVSSILMAIGVVSLHHRNGLILHGGDTIMRQFALLIAIAPSGAAVSLDRYFARKRGAPAIPEEVSLWPQRMMAIQVAIVYYTTVWHKWAGSYWRDGTANWYPMHLNEFDRFYVPPFMASEWFIKLTTYGTLILEVGLATLVFVKPFRRWIVLGGVLLHLFIEYSMNIPLFAFLMMSSYVSFYEGGELANCWDWIKAKFSKGAAQGVAAGKQVADA